MLKVKGLKLLIITCLTSLPGPYLVITVFIALLLLGEMQGLVPAESYTFTCHPRAQQSQPKHRHGRKWGRREVELLWYSICGAQVPHWPRIWNQHRWDISINSCIWGTSFHILFTYLKKKNCRKNQTSPSWRSDHTLFGHICTSLQSDKKFKPLDVIKTKQIFRVVLSYFLRSLGQKLPAQSVRFWILTPTPFCRLLATVLLWHAEVLYNGQHQHPGKLQGGGPCQLHAPQDWNLGHWGQAGAPTTTQT